MASLVEIGNLVTSDSAVGTVNWVEQYGTLFDNDSYFSYAAIPNGGATSYYLKTTGYSFLIPTGSTIDGIEVVVRKAGIVNTGTRNAKDNILRLIVGGSIVGDDNADTATAWTDTAHDTTYGGSSDLWGLTWSPDDINANDFGIAFSFTGINDGTTFAPRIYHIEITVHYTSGGTAYSTTGETYCGTGANDASYGNLAWSGATNITASDNSDATAGDDDNTNYLKATNYGFAIPTDATIKGVRFTVECQGDSSGARQVSDDRIRIIVGGAIGSTDLSKDLDWIDGVGDSDRVYGGYYEMWGESLTPSDVNASNFGFALSAYCDSGRTAHVDSVTCEVCYEEASSGDTYNETGSGGAVAGGAAQMSVFNEVASGGAVAGGTALVGNIITINGSGGAVASGAATISSNSGLNGSGGAVASGAATINNIMTISGSGGVVASGIVQMSFFNEIGSGGAVAGGAAQMSIFNEVTSGGAVAGSTAFISNVMTINGSGGAVASGVANNDMPPVVAGGISGGGSATISFIDYYNGSGGVTTGGLILVRHIIIASGGSNAGGTAIISHDFVASGGSVASGEVSILGDVYGNGGISISFGGSDSGGHADISVTYNIESTGGITTSGEILENIFTATGGLSAGGSSILELTYNLSPIITASTGGVKLGGHGLLSFNGNFHYHEVGTGGAVSSGSHLLGLTYNHLSIEGVIPGGVDLQGETNFIEYSINSDNDDSREVQSDGMNKNNTWTLELGLYDQPSDPSIHGVGQIIGLKFDNIKISEDLDLVDVYIQFTQDQSNQGQATLDIYGEDVDNPSPFTNDDYNISSRTKTSNHSLWYPQNWFTKNESGYNQRTSDLSNVLQEIINRPGWSSNNSIAFIIEPFYGTRTAHSYRDDPALAPVLHIEWFIKSDTVTFNITPTGGCNVGGSAINYISRDIIGSSGANVAGEPLIIFEYRVRGGVTTCCTTAVNTMLHSIPDNFSGVFVGGDSLVSVNGDFAYDNVGEGGGSLGGSAEVSVSRSIIDKLNMSTGGEATIRYILSITASGGLGASNQLTYSGD